MKTEVKQPITNIVNEMDKPESTSELFTKTEMENTPFIIVTKDGESFGTFGRYIITEKYHTPEQVKAELEKMTWNRIIQVMTLVHTMLKNQE